MDPKAFLGRGWTYPVQPDARASDIALSEHEEDVRQAVRIILETNRGERVMRPDFGAGLGDFMFEPLSTTTYALIRHRVEESLVVWEPRIRLERIDVSGDVAHPGRVNIEIDYRVRATNTFYNLVHPFYLQEGGV
jgi:phage baseplate assembly protein W